MISLRSALLCSFVLPAACADDTSSGQPDGPDLGTADALGGSDGATVNGCPLVEGGSRNSWYSVSKVADGPIQETAVVALDCRVYVLGGFNLSQIVSAVQVYDPVADEWSSAAPMPRPVHHVNAAAHDGKIYVLGVMEGNFIPAGDVWVYDPGDDEWTARTPMPAGTERGASAVGVIDGKVYVAGGLRSGTVGDLSSYDIADDDWDVALPPMPAARDHMVGAAVNDVFYAISGRNNGVLSNRVDAFDPGEGGWSPRSPIPTARAGMAGAVVSDVIVVAGGEGNVMDLAGIFHETEAYDPAEDEWQILSDMATPRHGTGGAGIAGKFYVPGGADVAGAGPVDTNEVLLLP